MARQPTVLLFRIFKNATKKTKLIWRTIRIANVFARWYHEHMPEANRVVYRNSLERQPPIQLQ